MLSLSKPLSPERAAWYFERDNYYLTQEGEWYGKVAAGLNLSGRSKEGIFLNYWKVTTSTETSLSLLPVQKI
jgi:hypothetical protein